MSYYYADGLKERMKPWFPYDGEYVKEAKMAGPYGRGHVISLTHFTRGMRQPVLEAHLRTWAREAAPGPVEDGEAQCL